MSRPIPEGVSLPHPNAVILGWGGEFKPLCAFEFFKGWALNPEVEDDEWEYGEFSGCVDHYLYAAYRNSEVARLNTNPGWFAEAMREIMQDPKDALIRELVGALEEIRKPDELVEANDAFAIHAIRRIQAQAQHALTLARTTCPEAFDGCNENSTS